MAEPGLSFRVELTDIKEELADFPKNYEAWTSKLAEASNNAYALKLEARLLRAKKEIAIRQDPLTYGFPKMTESTVTAVLDAQPDVVEADKAANTAESEVRVLKAIVESLDVKRSSLKYLSELAVSGFINLSPITGT